MTSEVEAPILKNNSTKTQLDEKMANHGSEGFILTTNIYKSANNSALLAPNKWKPEVKASVQAEGTSVKNQEKMTTKQLVLQKIYANKLNKKLYHPREDRIRATAKHIHCIIKGVLDVFKYCSMKKV